MSKKDVKLSQNVKKKKKKNKRPISKFLTIFMFIALGAFIFQMIRLNLLPFKLIILVSLVFVLLALILVILMNFKARKFFSRFLFGLISLCMCIGLAYGNYFMFKTKDTFDVVTSLADSKATTVSIVALKSSNIKKESDLKNKKIGTILSMDETDSNRMLKDLKSKKIKYSTKDYENLDELMEALYGGKVDVICLNEKYRDILHEAEEYFSFQTDSRIVYQNVHYTKVEKNDNPSDSVKDITKDGFTILVSGNDSYGSLQDGNTRSDANMLITVNPSTGRILMTSIPRDYYVELDCLDGGEGTSCPVGSHDKLTHSGLLGIKSTEKSVEKALGIKINYNVRVNFSSVVNLVDALDGIDLDIKEGEQVDILYANGQPGLSVGTHHVDGETALAFARERHAYADGDNQRVRNQQKVFKAIIKRIISPKMITNYGKFMDALAIAFDTNLSGDEICDFVKYELEHMPDWKFESYALSGDSGYEFCYLAQANGSVVYQNDIMNEVAAKKIKAILNGKKASSVKDPSGVSQKPSKGNAIGNEAELRAMGEQNEASEYDEDYGYDYDYDYSYDPNEENNDYYNEQPSDEYYSNEEETY